MAKKEKDEAAAPAAEGAAPATTEEKELTLLEKIIKEGKMARDESQVDPAQDIIGEFVNQILDETIVVKEDTLVSIMDRIAQIDELLTNQLNEIMHDDAFQELEATWRGINYLVMNSETGTMLKLKVMNITKGELLSDLEKAVEFDQSSLFKKVYEEEYGTFGGFPFSTMIGNYEFGRHPQDIALLEKVSNVCAAAHAPFIASANPKLFDMDSFTELGNPRDLSKIFESTELIKWRSFRESEDSRYVSLVLPRTLIRLPYGPDTVPVEEFDFTEDVDGRDHAKYLWASGAWALAQRITDAFAKHSWCAAIRGVEGGGLVEGLPAHTFTTDEGDIALKCPTETAITDRREKELNDLGFISLVHCKGTDYAAFFGGKTTQKPKLYNKDAANANAFLSSSLPYLLAASRFAHYIKAIMRDKIGSFQSAADISTYMNNWIMDYVVAVDDAGFEIKAKYPLRDARVDITSVAGKPGSYKAVVFLKPHFQLEELTTSIRLVAELPGAGA